MTLNIHKAKTHLSKYVELVAQGETIILCKNNVPIAEIRPLSHANQPRPIGLHKGQIEIGPGFFEPMDEEFLAAFAG